MRANLCFCLANVTHSKTVVRNPNNLWWVTEPGENASAIQRSKACGEFLVSLLTVEFSD